MKCRRAKALIFDFVDGMAGDRDRIELEKHLGECPSCESMAKSLSRSLDLLHRVPPERPDENFAWKVRLAVARERNRGSRDPASERKWLRSWNVRFAFSAVSTFVVVLATGYFLTRSLGTSGRTTAFLPEEPATTANRFESKIGRSNTPTDLPSGPVGPGFVATGEEAALGKGDDFGLLKEDPAGSYIDSLMNELRGSQRVRVRARVLEQQVRLLQSKLRECEGQD